MSASAPQFIDSNVLVYAYDRSAGGKHKQAQDLIAGLWRERSGCLSIQILQEFYVTVTRKVANPISSEAAAQLISDLSAWEVHRPNVNDILEAIQLQTRFRLSFWDAMVLTSARQLECSTLWSEDLSNGQRYEGVVVQNPFIQE